jgi:hypothetical protein
MSLFIRCLACVAMLALPAGRASAAETFFLVRLSDMTRADTVQVMTADELKQLQKQLQQEERFFPKALVQAVEEWRKDDMNKTVPFPSGKIVPRKIMGQAEAFSSREKAEERIAQYEDREARKRMRESEKAGNKNPTPAEKAKQDREMDKELTARRAADIVTAKLSALTGVESAPADPAAGNKADAKAPEAKKDVEKAPEAKKEAGAALNKAL